MGWIDDVLRQHAELESPMTFWFWSGLAAMSATLKDHVWLDQQLYRVYPNIYVMLHARSGLKKGPPIAMARQLVQSVNNTRIINGRSSIQGILSELRGEHLDANGNRTDTAVAFLCSSELTASIVEDRAAFEILTDLYDRHYHTGVWRSLLKRQIFDLKSPTITMLTATNEAHAEDFFGRKDVQGGYFARTFVVYANEEHCVNPLVDPLEHPPDYQALSGYLKELARLRGPFRPLYRTEAGEFYKRWYQQFAVDRKDYEDETGTLNRFHDSVLKVAMLLSLSSAPQLEISLAAMQQAIRECEQLIGHMRRVTMGRSGINCFATRKTEILKKLAERIPPMISRQQLLRDMHAHLSADEIDAIMKEYHQSGEILTQWSGQQIVYIMPTEEAEAVRAYFRGRMTCQPRHE